MLLQEIFKPEYANFTELYGIELDADSSQPSFFSPPQNFDALGFVFRHDADGLIDDQLMDILIEYNQTNMNIFIEVPSQLLANGLVDAKYLIQLSTNVGFMISLLPPGHPFVGDAITPEQYQKVIRDFTEQMVQKQNYDKFVVPVSNFMEYLMLECLLGKDSPVIKNFAPDNTYIKENFSTVLSVEHSDAFKKDIREVLYNYYGGQENFELVANMIFNGVKAKSREIYTQHVNEYLHQQHETNSNNSNEQNNDSGSQS
jgi:hypothetical protein